MRIRWTEPAVQDLFHISDYVATHGSADAARRIALSIHTQIESLAQFPGQGRMGRKAGTRELVIVGLPYVVIYRVQGDAVELLRILHGAQIWP